LAFHDLGSRRVEKAMSALVRPATTVIFLPSFSKTAFTTSFGWSRKKGLAPENQKSV